MKSCQKDMFINLNDETVIDYSKTNGKDEENYTIGERTWTRIRKPKKWDDITQ